LVDEWVVPMAARSAVWMAVKLVVETVVGSAVL